MFHVYDKLHLDQIPRRYTVEAGKELRDDSWSDASDKGRYDLWVLAQRLRPQFRGTAVPANAPVKAEIELSYDPANASLDLRVRNRSPIRRAYGDCQCLPR